MEINNEIIIAEERFNKHDESVQKYLVGQVTEYMEDIDTVEIMIKPHHYISFRFEDLERLIK